MAWFKYAAYFGLKSGATHLEMENIRKRGKEEDRRYKLQSQEYMREAETIDALSTEAQFGMVREGAEEEGAFSAAAAKSGVGGQSVRTRKRAIASRNREEMLLLGKTARSKADELRRAAREARRRGRYAKKQSQRDMWGAGIGGAAEMVGGGMKMFG